SSAAAAPIIDYRSSILDQLSIVVEEVDESLFWLEFVMEENLIEKNKVTALHQEGTELKAIFIASRKTAAKNR
ncbi:MAG: hypothetical protein ACE5IY_20710, partial [bacterium]